MRLSAAISLAIPGWQKYRAECGDGDDKEVRSEISRALDTSPTLRNKEDLIGTFVDSVSGDGAVDEQWQVFIVTKREAELEAIIEYEQLRADQLLTRVTGGGTVTITGAGSPSQSVGGSPSESATGPGTFIITATSTGGGPSLNPSWTGACY